MFLADPALSKFQAMVAAFRAGCQFGAADFQDPVNKVQIRNPNPPDHEFPFRFGPFAFRALSSFSLFSS
jgi:hypothetical protein